MSTKKAKPIVWVIGITIMILIVGSIVLYFYELKSKPLLKVIVRNPGVLIFSGDNAYYSIRPNGIKQKIDIFEPIEGETYRVDENNSEPEILIDNIRGNRIKLDSPLYEIANNIVELIKETRELKNPDISVLYILDGRYFFDVFAESSGWFAFSGFSDTVYEYFPIEKRIEKIVKFNTKNIEHIELY